MTSVNMTRASIRKQTRTEAIHTLAVAVFLLAALGSTSTAEPVYPRTHFAYQALHKKDNFHIKH